MSQTTCDTTVDVALDFAQAGFRVFPVAISWDEVKCATNKRPLTVHGHTEATTDSDRVRDLFAHPPLSLKEGEVLGVGYVPGSAGLVVFDIDRKGGKDGFPLAEALDIPAHCVVTTASGAEHRLVRKLDASAHVTNSSPWEDRGIEIRGDGGWTVAPGTTSPWGSWEALQTPLELVADAPDCPADLWAQLDTGSGNGTSTTWHEYDPTAVDDRTAESVAILCDRYKGHHPVIKRSAGREPWVEIVRPGKRAGNGATVGYIGPGVVKMWTSDWPPFKQGARYTLDGLLHDPPLTDREERGPDLIDEAQAKQGEPDPAPEEDAQLSAGSDGGWHRIDLTAALAGAIGRTLPTVFEREDHLCHFYAGRLNGVHGDSGTGKSMVMALAAAQEMNAKRHVGWVDLEDPDPTTLIERERMLGVKDATIAERLHYYAPREPFSDEAVTELVREAAEHDISLLVIDSLGEAFSLNGVNEDRDNEVGPFLRRYMRPLADAGPAVVTVDHSTKANDNSLHPSGSKRKRAAIQGASYLIEAPKPLTREHGGRLRLICAKDRHGNYRRGATVATIDMHIYEDGGVSVQVWPPEIDDRDTPDAKLFAVARAAVRAAKEAGRPLSQRQLLELINVKGSSDLKRAGIETAVQLDGLRIEPGKRNAELHHYVKDLAESART